MAHITIEELIRKLSQTDIANGFGNRFLWFYAKRSKCLPMGGDLSDDALDAIIARLKNAAGFCKTVEQIRFNHEAAAWWCQVYPELSEGGRGLAGVMTSRNEAHAVRLALLYALLDLSREIKVEHLRAALAVVAYSEASVKFIFGSKLGDDAADEILRLLVASGDEGMSRSDISAHFNRNKPSSEIGRALSSLKENHLVFMREDRTKGRSVERWYAIRDKGGNIPPQLELFRNDCFGSS